MLSRKWIPFTASFWMEDFPAEDLQHISIQVQQCENDFKGMCITCCLFTKCFVLLDKEFYLFIYLGFYITFNTVQVISRWVVGRAEETSTYSSLGFCTVNWRPTASNYQLSHLRPCRESNPSLRGGRRECYHSATMAPCWIKKNSASVI